MVKRNLFRYSSVLMCVVLTAASLVAAVLRQLQQQEQIQLM